MNHRIYEAEVFPVYGIADDDHGRPTNISAAVKARYDAAHAEWWAVQNILEELWEAADPRRRKTSA